MKRSAEINRKTNETDIHIQLDLDGSGIYQVDAGIAFLDHMLSHMAVDGLFDLHVTARGDSAHRPTPHRGRCSPGTGAGR